VHSQRRRRGRARFDLGLLRQPRAGRPYKFTCGARRTLHLRFNDFTDPEPVPHGTDFSSVISSNVPIVVQHTRLDTRQAALALLSTMAFPMD
jgi:hypothetical protein